MASRGHWLVTILKCGHKCSICSYEFTVNRHDKDVLTKTVVCVLYRIIEFNFCTVGVVWDYTEHESLDYVTVKKIKIQQQVMKINNRS